MPLIASLALTADGRSTLAAALGLCAVPSAERALDARFFIRDAFDTLAMGASAGRACSDWLGARARACKPQRLRTVCMGAFSGILYYLTATRLLVRPRPCVGCPCRGGRKGGGRKGGY
jgi:hypothetical protein